MCYVNPQFTLQIICKKNFKKKKKSILLSIIQHNNHLIMILRNNNNMYTYLTNAHNISADTLNTKTKNYDLDQFICSKK